VRGAPPICVPNTHFCVTSAIADTKLKSAPNGGSLRGRVKTQVALRDRIPVSLRPRFAEFTVAD
jgi:hypothetical protein